jgi:N-methylhydantoinase A
MAQIVALDIGGTFTDLVSYDSASGSFSHAKSATTPAKLIDGILQCLEKSELDLAALQDFVHGSTTAINTVLERSGARTALVVTQGTRDVYSIGRQNRPDAYDIFFHRPRPLVSRRMTFEVNERTLASGEILTELTDETLDDLVEKLAPSEPDAIAICLLHSYANPEHERRVAEAISKAFPSAYITASNEILREYREYERISSTVLNAYIGPRVKTYLEDFEGSIRQRGFAGQLFIMQSNGGAMSPDIARQMPVAMMESGPVGGIAAAAEVGRRLDLPNLIAFDMGGTTAKSSLVADFQPTVTQGYYIGGYTSGQPLMLPVVDVIEVGTGGGSIAEIDEVGALRVGPRSAGGQPGPICYGWGGDRPTVTDANLVLGRLSPTNFLGGEMPLDVEAARKGIEEQIARPLGIGVIDAAHGIVDIALASMALGVRAVSVERGYDPREFALIAFGGAGPLHACAIARDLHIPKVVIPLFPGHFSAVGMLSSSLRHDYVRTLYTELDQLDWDGLAQTVIELRDAGARRLHEEGASPSAISMDVGLDVRYKGQEFTLTTPVTNETLTRRDAEVLRRDFAALHHQRYGHSAPTETLEVVNVRVVASAGRQTPAMSTLPGSGSWKAGTRQVVFERGADAIDTPIVLRDELDDDAIVVGPAIVEEYASTTVLWPGDRLQRYPSGELLIELAQEES